MNQEEYNLAKKFQVINYYNEGLTEREIQKETQIPKSTIHDIISKYKLHGTVLRLRGTGRPKALDDKDKNILLEYVEADPKISSRKLCKKLEEETGKVVCNKTIIRSLNELGFKSRVPKRLPLLSSKNIMQRSLKSEEWSNWTLKQWNNVLFSDETKINLYSSDGREKVWRKAGEALLEKNITPTVKHSSSVMVWGCMAASGVGKLVFIDGNMDRFLYKRILAENLEQSKDLLGLPNNFIFQQDNDPKHTSNYVKDFFKDRYTVLEWPSQSPDLNPIEHLWDHVKREVRKCAPSNIRELKETVSQIWSEITPEMCRKLIGTMPSRCEEMVRNRGGHTSF